MHSKVVFSCKWASLFIVELTGNDGEVLGYQLQEANGNSIGSYSSIYEALVELERLLDEYLLEVLGEPESEPNYPSPGL